ncbi:MAG: HEAT repeat domain-containing protein [Planctomycetes bacterium]|nr:HEAT repeat domain-containing protein [Planctomycetota bacterium]
MRLVSSGVVVLASAGLALAFWPASGKGEGNDKNWPAREMGSTPGIEGGTREAGARDSESTEEDEERGAREKGSEAPPAIQEGEAGAAVLPPGRDEGQASPAAATEQNPRAKARIRERELRELILENLRNPERPWAMVDRKDYIQELLHHNLEPETLDLLIWLLKNDDQPHVRETAISTLKVWLHERRTWETLLDVARTDPDQDVRSSALIELASWLIPPYWYRDSIIEVLKHAIETDTEEPAGAAAEVLGLAMEDREECRAYLLQRLEVETRPKTRYSIELGIRYLDYPTFRR